MICGSHKDSLLPHLCNVLCDQINSLFLVEIESEYQYHILSICMSKTANTSF